MKRFKTVGLLLGVLFVLSACVKDATPSSNPGSNVNTGGQNNGNNDDWLLPIGSIVDGGPGKDGIPAIEFPRFEKASQVTFLAPDDLVIGVQMDSVIKAYPHHVLDWHEIVNDVAGKEVFALTYCPLTGTGIAWNRLIDGLPTTFGVSGLLYNSNLIPYDRRTGSNWSQMFNKCVNGPLSNRDVETFPVFETTWETWKKMFPNSDVMNYNTGFFRTYGRYPYSDYKTNHNFFLFNVETKDSRLLSKERGLGIIAGETARFYPLSIFEKEIRVIEDTFLGDRLVIAGSGTENFIVAYKRNLADGTELSFSAVQNGDAVIMQDNEGNKWSAFGYALEGPRAGTRLEPVASYMGFWFAWGAFFPKLTIYSR